MFRDTFRAAESISALAKVEMKLQEAQEKKERRQQQKQLQVRLEKPSHSHYRFHPDLDTGFEVIQSGHDSTRSSLDVKLRPVTLTSVFEDEKSPTKTRHADESQSTSAQNRKSINFLSLHAFDGGVYQNGSNAESTETLGQVLVLGWEEAGKKLGETTMPEVGNESHPGFEEEKLDMNESAVDHSLPPPRRKRKEGHHYSSRIVSRNASQESFASCTNNPPTFNAVAPTLTLEQEIKNAPPFI